MWTKPHTAYFFLCTILRSTIGSQILIIALRPEVPKLKITRSGLLYRCCQRVKKKKSNILCQHLTTLAFLSRAYNLKYTCDTVLHKTTTRDTWECFVIQDKLTKATSCLRRNKLMPYICQIACLCCTLSLGEYDRYHLLQLYANPLPV